MIVISYRLTRQPAVGATVAVSVVKRIAKRRRRRLQITKQLLNPRRSCSDTVRTISAVPQRPSLSNRRRPTSRRRLRTTAAVVDRWSILVHPKRQRRMDQQQMKDDPGPHLQWRHRNLKLQLHPKSSLLHLQKKKNRRNLMKKMKMATLPNRNLSPVVQHRRLP